MTKNQKMTSFTMKNHSYSFIDLYHEELLNEIVDCIAIYGYLEDPTDITTELITILFEHANTYIHWFAVTFCSYPNVSDIATHALQTAFTQKFPTAVDAANDDFF